MVVKSGKVQHTFAHIVSDGDCMIGVNAVANLQLQAIASLRKLLQVFVKGFEKVMNLFCDLCWVNVR